MFLPRRTLLAGAAGLAGTLAHRRAEAQANAGDTIRIGFTTALSGPAAPIGQPIRIGGEAARDWVNAHGGVLGKKLELVVLDNGGNPNQAIANHRQYAADGIRLIAGPSITATLLAAAGIINELKCVTIGDATPDERFTHDLYSKYLFCVVPAGYMRQSAIAQTMAQHFPNVTTWTGAISDNAAGHSGWASFAHAMNTIFPKLTGHTVTLLDPVPIKFGSSDLKPAISSLMASTAPGFWTNLNGADGITFYQQAQQFGLAKKFTAMVDYGIDIDLPKTLKHNVPSNVWTVSYWYYGAHLDNPMTRALVQAFEKATGSPAPHAFAQNGHNAVIALAAGITKAASTDPEAVAAAMAGMSFETLSGTAMFRAEDHQWVGRQNLVRWEPTEAEPGWKAAEYVTIEDRDLLLPPAPGQKWVE